MKHIAQDGYSEWSKYLSKHGGRKRFQIDLGIELMDYGIRLDWNGNLDNLEGKPKWIRQTQFLPCSCGVCFFCQNGYTGGIYHSPQKKRAGRMKKVPFCSGDWERMTYQRYCGPCYMKHRELHPKEKSKKSARSVTNTTFGCTVCNNHVCKKCWPNYEHKYEVLK